MGSVYEVLDLAIERTVALKLINSVPNVAESEMRFRQEAQALSLLSHKHIVSIYSYGIWHEHYHYIIMPLIDGKTLRDLLNDQVRLPLSHALEIAEQLADALGAAHAVGIVHRDIKPNNVFITSDNQAKLIDFGLCKLISEDGGLKQQLTGSGLLIGSSHYMSPEACQGKPVTHSADIYAIGILLFEMITGHPPFMFDSPIGLLHLHVHEPIPLLHEHFPLLPYAHQLDTIVSSCLAKDPADRFFDMAQLKLAIAELRDQASDSNSMRSSYQLYPTCAKKLQNFRHRIPKKVVISVSIFAAAVLLPLLGSKLLCLPTLMMPNRDAIRYEISAANLAQSCGLVGYENDLLEDAHRHATDPLVAAELSNQLAHFAVQHGNRLRAVSYAKQALTSLGAASELLNLGGTDRERIRSIIQQSCEVLKAIPGNAAFSTICNTSNSVLKISRRSGCEDALLPLLIMKAKYELTMNNRLDYACTSQRIARIIRESGGSQDAQSAWLHRGLAALAPLPEEAVAAELPCSLLAALSECDLLRARYKECLFHVQQGQTFSKNSLPRTNIWLFLNKTRALVEMKRLEEARQPFCSAIQLWNKLPENILKKSVRKDIYDCWTICCPLSPDSSADLHILRTFTTKTGPGSEYELDMINANLCYWWSRFRTASRWVERAEDSLPPGFESPSVKERTKIFQARLLIKIGDLDRAACCFREAAKLQSKLYGVDKQTAREFEMGLKGLEKDLQNHRIGPSPGLFDYGGFK